MPHIALRARTLNRGSRIARAAALAVLATGLGAGPRPALAQRVLVVPQAALGLEYQPLTFGADAIIPTGIRGDTITGTYVLSGGETAGLINSTVTGIGMPFPVNAPATVNFPVPGTIANTPYGPSFGSYGGILRAVGSYQTSASSPYDLGYLYDGAALGGKNVITLQYPSTPRATTLFTIPHSTFGTQLVGNYDTSLPGGLATGNAFIYNIPTGTYKQNNFPGAVSTTAYGIWGNMISGGYAGPLDGTGVTHGYIYNQTTGVWTTYNYPGSTSTHFEGISGGGQAGSYNLVTDYTCVSLGNPACSSTGAHAAVLHIDAVGNQTWYDIDVPGAKFTSANSAYQGEALGIYIDANGVTHGYTVEIPGIYNPATIPGRFFPSVVSTSAPNSPAGITAPGDDVINNGVITTSGTNSPGIRGNDYGVLTNNGTISVSGARSSAILMNGTFGTLLNTGVLRAVPGALAIGTTRTASGSLVVNYGTIDGQVNISAGPYARFENSGWLGITAPGAGTTQAISGTFAQTGTGMLQLRLGANGSHDSLRVGALAQIGGALALVPQPGLYANSTVYSNVVSTAGTLQGSFSTVPETTTSPFLQSTILTAGNSITATLARTAFNAIPGLTPNEMAVGNGLEHGYSGAANLGAAGQSFYTNLMFNPAITLPRAYNALSGEGTSGTQNTAFLAGSLFTQTLTNRMIGWVAGGGAPTPVQSAAAPAGSVTDATLPILTPGWHSWVSGLAGSLSLDGNGGSGIAGLDNRVYGGAAGLDYQLNAEQLVGVGVAGTSSSFSVNDGSASGQMDAGHIGLYGAQRWGATYATAILSYSGFSNSISRSVTGLGTTESETGQFRGDQLGVRLEAGRAWTFDPVRVTPFAAVQLSELWQDGYNENGTAAAGGPANLSLAYAPISVTSLPISLGAQVDAQIVLANGMVLAPYARVAWEHEFFTTRQISASLLAIPGSSFTVDGASAGRDLAKLDLGSRLVLSPAASLFVSFNSEFSDVSRSYAGTAGVTISF